MTVIAWDGRYVAADSQSTFGDRQRCLYPTTKLTVKGAVVYGHLGSDALQKPMIDWYEKGHDPEKVPVDKDDDTILLIFADGICKSISARYPYPIERKAPEAWGCGEYFALGALLAGATSERAVEIACKVDIRCGGPVQIIDLLEIQKDREAA
jgi:hypothetical protein